MTANRDIAALFSEIADLMELLGEDRFRVNSYRKASRIVEDLSEDLRQVARSGALESIAGIGKSTAEKIRQFLDEGKIDLHQELLAKVPAGVPGLLSVGGLGPKTAGRLWKQADVTSVDELRRVIAEQPERLEKVSGMGARKIQALAEALAFMDASAGRILLSQADELARRLCERLARIPGAQRVEAAGSLRRGRETIGDIDILCQAEPDAAETIIAAYAEQPGVTKVLSRGPTKCYVLLEEGIEADLRVVGPESFGAALAYFTGSKDHNVALRQRAISQGRKLSEYGLFEGDTRIAGAREEEIYAALSLPWIAPELREDRGEIVAAEQGRLPDLLELEDIRGDMHMHTTASDGANTIAEMIDACRARGYRYMTVSDHSQSQVQANGLSPQRLADHARAIRAQADAHGDITVWAGIEVDIFKDGSLDYEDEVLAELDFVTASPHSALSQEPRGATDRIIRAIEHPLVHCIGHPSGRLINRRPGMEPDIAAIAEAAAANDTALEINANPNRLDLRDTHVRAAVEAGARIVINTDAHSIAELDLMRYGVLTARRGWAGSESIVNTWPAERVARWIAQKGP